MRYVIMQTDLQGGDYNNTPRKYAKQLVHNTAWRNA